MKPIFKVSLFVMVLTFGAASARAETASPTASAHAGTVGAVCPGQWESQDCLKAVSESNMVLAANYMETLVNRNLKPESEKIKQHCAASTAATQGEYPAYAMKSAFTECANMISDVSDLTGVTPDVSHYQILVGSVLCMDKDQRCAVIEQGLRSQQ